jgi:hypothetical protein
MHGAVRISKANRPRSEQKEPNSCHVQAERTTNYLTKTRHKVRPIFTDINGIRLVGGEGGVASGGFLGVFELSVLTTIPQPVRLLNPQVVPGGFRFEFNSQLAVSHTVQRKNRLEDLSWETLSTIIGDGARKQVTISPVAPRGLYRINSQ